jgi:hypothetical protein
MKIRWRWRLVSLTLICLVLNAHPVSAAPLKTTPRSVTTTITATISRQGPTVIGQYGNGFCEVGTVDIGSPWGNVDFGWNGYEGMNGLAWNFSDPWFVDGQVSNDLDVAAPPDNQVCYTRTDTFAFDLSSVSTNAIVQSATLTFDYVGAGSNQSRAVQLQPSSTTIGYIAPTTPTLPGNISWGSISSSPTYPTATDTYTSSALANSLVQGWVTNRTSGNLWI